MTLDELIEDLKQRNGEFWEHFLAESLWNVIWMMFSGNEDKETIMENIKIFG